MTRLATLAAAALAAALPVAPAHARPGDVDASFGAGGQALFRAADSTIRGLAQQPDGKLLVSGWATGSGGSPLARLTAGGATDPTFVAARVPATPRGDPVVLEDGRIVLVGVTFRGSDHPGATQVEAVRLLPDGRTDPSFGTDGVAVVPGGGERPSVWGAFAQSDGRLVLLGQAELPGSPSGWGATATRLMPDGSLDESFGDKGWTPLEVPDSSGLVYEGFEQPNGKLVIAGEFDRRDTQAPDYHWTLIRLTTAGAKDPSFDGDGDGVAQGSWFGQGGTFGDFAVQPDGKLLLAGAALNGGSYGWGISRHTADGEPDPSFGENGRVWFTPPGTDPANPLVGGLDRLAVQNDGRIVASGNRSGPLEGMTLVSAWALARLTPIGEPDPEFGDAGWSGTAFGFGNRLWPAGLVRTPDGKVVMAGDATDCGQRAISLVRFHAENADADKPDAGPAMRTCDPVVEAEPDGDLPIEVQCPLTEDVCRGTGEVEIPSAGVPVGRRSFKLRGAHEGTIRIRASRRARRYIARPRGVRAQIVYTTKDGDGHRRVTRRKLRLKRG